MIPRLLCALLALAPLPAHADGYVMGAGRWTCTEAIRIAETGSPIEKGQLFGWIMGFWSAATFERETGFVDTVEAAGAKAIADATITECRKTPGDTALVRLSQTMIRNTR